MGTNSSKLEDDPKKSLEHDPNFKGPIKNRGCTDVLCCFLFLIFFIIFIAVGIYGFAMGDPRMLVFPADSYGRYCGQGINYGKPYLFYFDLKNCFSVSPLAFNTLACSQTPQICVKKCPNIFWNKESEPSKAFCKPGETPNKNNLNKLINDKKCASYYFPMKPVLFRCMPSINGQLNNSISAEELTQTINGTNTFLKLQGYGSKILSDLAFTWWLILLFIALAMVISLIWLLLMRWIAGVMVWLTIFLFIAFFAGAMGFSFYKYNELKKRNDNSDFIFSTNVNYYAQRKETWLAFGIVAAIVLGVTLLILLVLIKRIRIAVAIIKEASRAVSSMLFTLLWPLIPFILQIILFGYWIASILCIAAITRTKSCNIYNSTDNYQGPRCQINALLQGIDCSQIFNNTKEKELCLSFQNGFTDDRYTLVLQAFQLFMLFWISNFIIALSQMVLAGCFSTYYWTYNKSQDLPMFPVTGSFFRTIRYHLGTLAFGGLIVAIVQFIIALLEYLDHKLKGKTNVAAQFCIKCCICCFWCLEKFLKFLNKNAYIMTAIHGSNFCKSAFKAFNLIMRNMLRVIVVDKITDIVIFVNKLFIVASVGVFAYCTFARQIPGSKKVFADMEINFIFVPILIVIMGSYIVAAIFFSVYDMGVDTIFLCFLEDLERNDGSQTKPYFMSKNLMSILGKSNSKVNPSPPSSIYGSQHM